MLSSYFSLDKLFKIMKSLFEDSLSRVWHDGTSPIVFVRFTKILDKNNFLLPGKITVNFAKQLLRDNKNAYALIDLSEFNCTCPKINEHFYHWLTQLHSSCIEFTAIVIPEHEKMPSQYFPTKEKIQLSTFSSFEKALRNINTQMTMNLLAH
jgi:hypothetical protein